MSQIYGEVGCVLEFVPNKTVCRGQSTSFDSMSVTKNCTPGMDNKKPGSTFRAEENIYPWDGYHMTRVHLEVRKIQNCTLVRKRYHITKVYSKPKEVQRTICNFAIYIYRNMILIVHSNHFYEFGMKPKIKIHSWNSSSNLHKCTQLGRIWNLYLCELICIVIMAFPTHVHAQSTLKNS